MVSPSPQCHCHQRTVFFKYPSFIVQDYQNFNISELTIRKKEYFVGGLQYFRKNLKAKKSFKCLEDALKNNNIIRLYHSHDTNLYWKNNNANTEINFNLYQKYNNILKHVEITRKDLLYKNYKKMRNSFPNDFNYMPETYTSVDINNFKMMNKNYKVSKDNLWLVKPKGLSRGRKIFILKDIKDIKNNYIVTKYISNPLLIDNRKFDLRLYLLVTGHNPLKAYLYDKGLVRLSSEPYDLDLNDLNNLFKHLTNTSINKNNKKGFKYDDLVLSLEEAKNYIKERYNKDFSVLWDQIKDISIKSLISMNHLEIEKEKMYNLHSNNLFKLYGVDIIIDENFKPWLLEINHSPDLSLFNSENHAKITKYKLVHDILNVIGLVPYSHIDGHALEGECHYESSIEEAVDQSICEFTRPLGGFELIFPLKENIGYYKKFFKDISPNNQALWNEINDYKAKSDKRNETDNDKTKNSSNSKESINKNNHKKVKPHHDTNNINDKITYFLSTDMLKICLNNKYNERKYENTMINFEKYCLECSDGENANNKECVKCPYEKIFNQIKILSPINTLNEIIYNNKSISRFGDGEFNIINGKNKCNFQKYEKNLSERLKKILQSDEEGLLIGISDSIKMSNINKFNKRFKRRFNNFILHNKFSLLKLLDFTKQYYSANISRFYVYYEDKSYILEYIKQLKKIWNNRDILIVEGEKSRLGVGNDLFNNTKSIQRILCPTENAFSVYDKIFNEVIKHDKNKLVLIALGPTASILAYDLYKEGYQAIDIGHVDLEYEWFKKGANRMVKIKNKYVNNVRNGKKNIKRVKDKKYYKEIIAKISI